MYRLAMLYGWKLTAWTSVRLHEIPQRAKSLWYQRTDTVLLERSPSGPFIHLPMFGSEDDWIKILKEYEGRTDDPKL